VARVLDDLQHSDSAAPHPDLGDPFLLQQDFENVSLSDLKKTFGEQFASAITALPVGSWKGPIESGYGTHLVYVAKHADSRLPAFADVREQVRREYLDAKRREATEKFYTTLLSRYSVRIEPPEEKKLAQVR
jgi:peptidyl-prolyl cis-trans isomerase C